MIFATVGGQTPFDRLVEAVDSWAGERGRRDVFAQIGNTKLRPRFLRWERFLSPTEFRRMVAEAEYVVAHAGMGTIITALELGTPILVMPRRADLKETRNDHQLGVARLVGENRQIHFAAHAGELRERLDQLHRISVGERISTTASGELIEAIRSFIEQA